MIASLVLGAAIPEIVVTGRGIGPVDTDGLSTITIDARRIDHSASRQMEDVLRDVAGLTSFRRSNSRSSHPTSQGLSARGLGGNAASRMLLILDGVPQPDPFGGWINFAALDPDAIDRIRIQRGGGVRDGPGALAGTITLDSKALDVDRPLSGSLAVGSRSSIDAALAAGGAAGGGFLIVTGAHRHGDGFVPIVSRDRGAADRAAPYRQSSVRARLVEPIGNAEAQFNLSGFADRRDRGFANSINRSEGVDASLRLVAPRWSVTAYRQWRAFESRFASLDQDRDTATLVLDQYRVPARGLGGSAQWRALAAPTDLWIGADLRRVEGTTNEHFRFIGGSPTRNREAGGHSLTLGAFADLSAVRANWRVGAGGRIDRWETGDGRRIESEIGGPMLVDERFQGRSGWEWSGRLGIERRANETLSLRGATYRSWRLPTLNEFYRPFRVGADATAANAMLSPEHLFGLEGGFDWHPSEHARLSATLFRNHLSGAIANVRIAEGPGNFPGVGFVAAGGQFRRRDNLDAIDSFGVELDSEIRRSSWFGRLSYAFTHARIDAGGIASPLDGLRPAQTPSHQASATIGWEKMDGPTFAATARFIGRQFEAEGEGRPLPSVLTADFVARWPLDRRTAVELRAENLFNRQVVAAIGSDGATERTAPRSLWIGWVVR